jgi:glucosamine--fructose-6-phosphate aminotransferase (isomerizing)
VQRAGVQVASSPERGRSQQSRIERMCGIVGYVGPGSANDVLLGGLKRQEYRGYDSAGVAIIDDAGRLETRKRAGKLGVLLDDLSDS